MTDEQIDSNINNLYLDSMYNSYDKDRVDMNLYIIDMLLMIKK